MTEPPADGVPRASNVFSGSARGHVFQAGVIQELHYHAARHEPAIPQDLPHAPTRFVNRHAELAALDRLVSDNRGTSVALLRGMPGVGKSATGRHWAHRNRTLFGDGQLYQDFSRHRREPDDAAPERRVDISSVLGSFLVNLGVDESALPSSLSDRAEMFRRATATRRLLVMLDDVAAVPHIKLLTPTGAGSVLLITSNYRLEELVYDGAQSIEIKPLGMSAAVRLLGEMAGHDRVTAETGAAEAIAALCDGLPVALCVCGARLAGDTSRTVAALLNRIRASGNAISALATASNYGVASVFDAAYQDLPGGDARLYRRLAVHPGPDLSFAAAAVLCETSESAAQVALSALHGAHLIEISGDDRLQLHRLIRDHARARLEVDEPVGTIDACARRLVDWYYFTLRAADRAVVLDRLRLTDELVEAFDVRHPVSPADAFAWYDRERANISSVIRLAAVNGWHERVWQFAEALWPFCFNHKLYAEWIESHELAVTAATELGDLAAEARVRSQLARAYADQRLFERANTEIGRALDAAAQSGNPMLRASVVEFGGILRLAQADPLSALASFEFARSLFVECSSVRGVALQNYHVGKTLVRLERFADSLSAFADADVGLASTNDAITMGRVNVQRSQALLGVGRSRDARQAIGEALRTFAGLEMRVELAQALEVSAAVAEARADIQQAQADRLAALRTYRLIGHPRADWLERHLNASS